jgi:hypothetical protein
MTQNRPDFSNPTARRLDTIGPPIAKPTFIK